MLLHRPLEAGWGWACVFGCAFVNFICVGILKSFGVTIVGIMEEFNCQPSTAAWIGSTCGSLQMILAPISGFLLRKYSCRSVTLAGAIISALGCMLSYFARSWVTMFFTYGAITGFGNSLVYTPSLVIISHYFDERKALANGLAICGVGIGTLILPPLVQFLMSEVKFSRTMLFLGAIELQMCISAVLYRPIGDNYAKTKEELNLANPILAGSDSDSVTSDKNNHKLKTKRSSIANDSPSTSLLSQIVKTSKSVNFGIIKDPKFFPFVFIYASYLIAVQCTIYYFVSLVVEKGIPKQQAAFLVSISGIMDLLGRISYGVILNFNIISKQTLKIYIITGILFVAFNLTTGLVCDTYFSFAFLSGATGFLTGGDMTAVLLIAQEIFGRENYSRVLPYSLFFLGLLEIGVPPFAGWMVNIHGSFTIVFCFAAAINFFGALAALYVHVKF